MLVNLWSMVVLLTLLVNRFYAERLVEILSVWVVSIL